MGMVVAGMVSIGSFVMGGATGAIAATLGVTAFNIAAGVIGGALVGAAIGGITSAVMGGDIGKGILFGAIGGAVSGGIGAWAQGPGSMMSVENAQIMGKIPTTVHGGEISQNFIGVTKEVVEKGAGGGAGLSLGSGAGMIGQGVLSTVGSMMEGAGAADAAETQAAAASAAADKNRESQEKMAAEQNELQHKLAGLTADTNLKIAGIQAATTQRGQDKNWDIADRQIKQAQGMFDTEKALAAQQLARQRNAASSARASVGGSKAGQNVNAPSIDQQVAAQEKALV